MDLQAFSFMFNRALSLTFVKKKLILVFFVLALSGLLVVFFRGLAWSASQWVQLSLTFLPIFLCAGILLAMGIMLIRVYHNEVKKRKINYRNVIYDSWEVIIGASYFAVPIIISYLLLWILLGLFMLLQEIPSIGNFFGSILSFAPFLINFGALLLCLFSLFMLFFVSPVVALRGIDRFTVYQVIVKRLEKDPFLNIVLTLIALLPLLFILFLLTTAALLTDAMCLDCNTLPQTVVTWFFIMLPFTAILTPAVIFFFNFAAEAHVLTQKNERGQTNG